MCTGTVEGGHSGRQVSVEESRRVSEAGAGHARGKVAGKSTRVRDCQVRAGYDYQDGGRAESKRGKVTSDDCRAAGYDGPRAGRGREGNTRSQGGELRGVQ